MTLVNNLTSSPFYTLLFGEYGLIKLKKVLCLSACITFATVCFTGSVNAQTRERVVKTISSQPTNLPKVPSQKTQPPSSSRPTLESPIVIVRSAPTNKSLITRTSSSRAVNTIGSSTAIARNLYSDSTSARLDQAIKVRYGIRYVYGTSGPNTYDCSGFVWSAFQEAGLNFTRQSARSLWAQSEPVYGDDRFKFGTLVFFNNLGHMGIVANENGFYQASSSKGITYSPFAGYWQSRIVGYRRLKIQSESSPVVDANDR